MTPTIIKTDTAIISPSKWDRVATTTEMPKIDLEAKPPAAPLDRDMWSIHLIGKAEQQGTDGTNIKIHVPYGFWKLLYDGFQVALDVAVPFIKDRFKDFQEGSDVIVRKIGVDEWGLFHTVYKPLGLSEIPLCIIRRHDVADELVGFDKYFYVAEGRIQPVAPR